MSSSGPQEEQEVPSAEMLASRKTASDQVVEVLSRCENAQENKNLDLNGCGFAYIPQAVFHIMKGTEVKTCDISNNDLKKLPAKFSNEFPKITELHLSHNKIYTLPVELNQLSELTSADLSHNKLVEIPEAMYTMTSLRQLLLCNNQIKDVDVEKLCSNSSLEEVDLQGNPLTSETWHKLNTIKTFTIKMDPHDDGLEKMD